MRRLLALMVLALLCLGACSVIDPCSDCGARGKLELLGVKSVTLAYDLTVAQKMWDGARAGDTRPAMRAILAGDAFDEPERAYVEVTGQSGDYVRVLIRNGDHPGQQGWLPRELVNLEPRR